MNLEWIMNPKIIIFYNWVCFQVLQQNAYEKLCRQIVTTRCVFFLCAVKSISHNFYFIVICRQIFWLMANVQHIEIHSFLLF